MRNNFALARNSSEVQVHDLQNKACESCHNQKAKHVQQEQVILAFHKYPVRNSDHSSQRWSNKEQPQSW